MRMFSDLFLWVTIATLLLLALELIAGRHQGVYNRGLPTDRQLLSGALADGAASTGLKALLIGLVPPNRAPCPKRPSGSLSRSCCW